MINNSVPEHTLRRAFWFDDGRTPNVTDELEKIAGIEVHRLQFDAPQNDNWAQMRQCQVYCITSSRDEVPDHYKVTAELLSRCPDLLIVSTSGAGYDPVDVEACTRAGVLVVNQTGANAEAVAEHVVAMMISLSKNMMQTDRSLRRERGVDRETFKGNNVQGRTLGLVGMGNTGSRVARICGHGLDMNILASDPYLDAAVIEERGATPVSLDKLLRESDFVSMHCPLNDETRGIIGARELDVMKHTAFLINCSRGGVVDEGALANSLESSGIAGAGVDVWVTEPPPMDHPLMAFENVFATFHTAGVTAQSRANMASWAADQIAATLSGGYPPRLINPDAWEKFSGRLGVSSESG